MDIIAGLNTVFKQVFGEGLKEHGFVKIKGRQPYLVRVIDDEIVHIVTCRNEWCGEKGYKEFSILGRVFTIYCKSIIDLSLSPHANANYLWGLAGFYSDSDPDNYNHDYWESIYTFSYKTDSDDSMRKAMDHALKETKKIMIPFLDKLADLESCIDYFERFEGGLITPPKYNEDEGKFEDGSSEGLWFIKINRHNDLIETVREQIDREIRKFKRLNISFIPDNMRKSMEEWRIEVVTRRDKIYNNPKVYAAALEELEQRKLANIERIRSYGLNI